MWHLVNISYWFYRVDEVQCPRKNANDGSEIEIDEESDWGSYARGALYALQSGQNSLVQVRDMSLMTFFSILYFFFFF